MGNEQGQLGRYDVDMDNPIGRGAFGAVFTGKDKKEGTPVAVKQCMVETDAQGTMALTEIKNYQHMSGHKHLVRLLDYHFKGNCFWLIMEYCDQGDLEDHMKTFKPDMPRQLKIMHQCTSALAFMHGLTPKAVHRDIKPNNILFKQEKDELVLKLADFGLAAIAEGAGSTVKLKTMGGTIPFMAPEILMEKRYNETVDVFALGVVFLAMLQFKSSDEHLLALSDEAMQRGEVKGIGEEMAVMLTKGRTPPDVVRLGSLDTDQVKGLKGLIVKMCKPSPADRPSMEAVKQELEQIADLKSSSTLGAETKSRFTSNLSVPTHRAAGGDSDSDEEDAGYRDLKKTVTEHLSTRKKSDSDDNELDPRLRALAGGLGEGLALLAMLHLAVGTEDGKGSKFSLGDRVLVEEDEQKVKAAQVNHGGWAQPMATYLGEEGVIQSIRPLQVEVMFHDGQKFNYNPAILTKLKPGEKKGKLVHGKFKRHEIVRVKKSVDVAQLQAAQKNHGGYNEKMKHCLGLRGVVHKIDSDGDIVVEFMSGDSWCLNPDILETVDMSGATLEGGDLVLILDDREQAIELQKGHGEWAPGMEKLLGCSGMVKKATTEKAVVEAGEKTFIWNPKCLRLVAKKDELVLVMLKKKLTQQ